MSSKRFEFPLNTVLRLRQHEAERAEQQLSRVINERRRREQAAEEARARLDEIGMRTAVKGHVSLLELQRRAAHVENARREVDAATLAVHDGRASEDAARATLGARRQAEEVLTLLKDQKREAHQQVMEAEQAAFLDEQGTMAFARTHHKAA